MLVCHDSEDSSSFDLCASFQDALVAFLGKLTHKYASAHASRTTFDTAFIALRSFPNVGFDLLDASFFTGSWFVRGFISSSLLLTIVELSGLSISKLRPYFL